MAASSASVERARAPDATVPAEAAPVLEVRDLRIELATRHGAVAPVDGVSLAIRLGEILAVVGESGAGKSLTGAAVLGLLEPPARVAGGEIRLHGRPIENLPERAVRKLRGKTIGAVFQDPATALDPLLTIGRQLGETIRLHTGLREPAVAARAADLLEQVGIADAASRLGQYPHQLSGGLRQRVVIALALAGEPDLLVADEPTTALDVAIQAQIIALLRRSARERGTAVLLVTHDMGVVAATADRVAVMYAGRIVEQGPVPRVLRSPRHPYTRGLLAAVPRRRERAGRLRAIEGVMPRLDAMPAGCAFHPRCPEPEPRCRIERPPLVSIGRPGGASEADAAACWRLDGEAEHG